MAMTVIKFCPKCKSGIDGGVDTRGIGKPFKVCENCGTYVIDKDNNEWALKTFNEKVLYILTVTWSAIFFGILFPFAAHVLSSQFSSGLSNEAFLPIWLFGILCCGVFLLYRHKQDIIESNIRMQDPEYREILIKLGLLK